MSTSQKPETPSSDFEDDSQDFSLESQLRVFHILDAARLAITVLALAAGITILGVSADSLAVYDATHVADNFMLPLWPNDFDLGPTVALVVGSAVVVLANAVSMVASRTQTVRSRFGIHSCITLAAAALAFAAAVVAMAWFYVVNASTTADSLQSWTCRWKNVVMTTRPHFNTLCKQSEVGVALTVLLVLLEAIILGVAVYQSILKRQLQTATRGSGRKTGSPALA